MPGDTVERPSFSNSITLGNIATMFGIAVPVVLGFVGYGGLTEKMNSLVANQARVELIVAKVPEIDYRSIANQEAIKSLVQRQEAQTSNLSNQLRELNNAIGGLQTSQAVILQRLDTLTPQQRTELTRRLASAQDQGIINPR